MEVSGTKIPLDDEGRLAVERLARWLRIVGSAQLGIASVSLALLMLVVGCGLMAGGVGGGLVMLTSMIPLVIVGVFVLQALRTQAAGEQFGELANERDVDNLEFGFTRLRTVFVIDVVVGALLLAMQLLGALA
ncbi:hypothetical protein ACNOYE_09005 [Nannocystaceae bacterium ST9]